MEGGILSSEWRGIEGVATGKWSTVYRVVGDVSEKRRRWETVVPKGASQLPRPAIIRLSGFAIFVNALDSELELS